MKTSPKSGPTETSTPATTAAAPASARHHRHVEEEALAISGAVTGAAAGLIAGPPGAIAGAVVGAALGAMVGHVLDGEDERRGDRDDVLDLEIGVSGGDLGAASPDQPPARVGAYSAASSGGGTAPSSVSEGPMQNPDGD